jgi:hypothetical protein
MTMLEDMRALVARVDTATTNLGLTSTGIAASLAAIAEAISAGLAEVAADLQRLRDSMGGAGGLKPGEADEVRRGLEASAARLEEAQARVGTDMGGAVSQLQAHALVLTELGRDEVLPPADPVSVPPGGQVNPVPLPPGSAEPITT